MAGALTSAEIPTYKPFLSGRYRVEAGLSRLGKDFGNGDADGLVFQFDCEFDRFRENLAGARADDLAKYWGETDAYGEVSATVNSFVARRLVYEHSGAFALERTDDGAVLRCSLTGDVLTFDAAFNFVESSDAVHVSGLDALASQVQEDLAVVRVDETGDTLVALHVVAPSYWDPSEKLGHDFIRVHAPVAGIAPLNPKAAAQFRAIQKGGRFVRFAWGAATPTRLNRHPRKPAWFEGSDAEWKPPRFDPGDPQLRVSVERQTLVGLETCVLFTIHPYFIDCRALPTSERRTLAEALETMTPESRAYKGLAEDFDAIVAWLRA